MNMNFDFSELSIENIGEWPVIIKAIVLVVVFLGVLFLGYWFDTSKQIDEYNSAKNQELKLKELFESKHMQSANLAAYREQLAVMGVTFQKLLQQLPSRSEVPGLLEDITKAGIANGLEFKLFKPLPEVQMAFYSELPIKIAVMGDYHQIGMFISEVAALDRIVTLHDFTLEPIKTDKPAVTNPDTAGIPELKTTQPLLLEIVAKTYRYTGAKVTP